VLIFQACFVNRHECDGSSLDADGIVLAERDSCRIRMPA
jgi:hypothetical protein